MTVETDTTYSGKRKMMPSHASLRLSTSNSILLRVLFFSAKLQGKGCKFQLWGKHHNNTGDLVMIRVSKMPLPNVLPPRKIDPAHDLWDGLDAAKVKQCAVFSHHTGGSLTITLRLLNMQRKID